jgi:hypothetical protein
MVDVTSFRFIGTLAGLQISNTTYYSAAFTPPETFTQSSDTTFLLWNNYKEKISNTTLTQAGSVTFHMNMVRAYLFLCSDEGTQNNQL